MKHHTETTDKEHFRELFREKSFWEANRTRYLLAQTVSYACNVISVLTAFTLPFTLLLVIIPDLPGQQILAGILSIMLLMALETAVRVEARALFISALKSNWRKVSGWSFLTLFLLFSASLYSSQEGAAIIAQKADTRVEQAAAVFGSDTSAVLASFRSAIQQEKAELEAYKKSVSWAGRIDVSNPATKRVIQQHADRIAALEEQAAQQVADIKTEYQERAADLKTDTARVRTLAAVAASLVVIVFMLCMWYLYYFGFRVVLEDQPEIVVTETETAAPERKRVNGSPVHVIGFQPGTPGTDAVKRSDGYHIRCLNCGTETVKSRPASFCSDKCRISHHKNKK